MSRCASVLCASVLCAIVLLEILSSRTQIDTLKGGQKKNGPITYPDLAR